MVDGYSMKEKTISKTNLIDELKKSSQRISELEKEVAKGKENEILLRESHHRIRNNLQIISSLFRLQSMKIKDKKLQEILRVSQSRIRSMALIHEKLCHSTDLARIELDKYIQDLALNLYHMYGIAPNIIKLNTDMENIHIEINKAVCLGLIINELISNSLRYAFSNNHKGEIRIGLRKIIDSRYELVISDNGVGFPEDIDFPNSSSLGIQLVYELVKQIEGNIDFNGIEGAVFRITF